MEEYPPNDFDIHKIDLFKYKWAGLWCPLSQDRPQMPKQD